MRTTAVPQAVILAMMLTGSVPVVVQGWSSGFPEEETIGHLRSGQDIRLATRGSDTGWRVKLNRPLDFIVIADHAENLGMAYYIRRSDPILLANETGKKWHDMVKALISRGDEY